MKDWHWVGQLKERGSSRKTVMEPVVNINFFGLLLFRVNLDTTLIVRKPTTFLLPHTIAFGEAFLKLYLFYNHSLNSPWDVVIKFVFGLILWWIHNSLHPLSPHFPSFLFERGDHFFICLLSFSLRSSIS